MQNGVLVFDEEHVEVLSCDEARALAQQLIETEAEASKTREIIRAARGGWGREES